MEEISRYVRPGRDNSNGFVQSIRLSTSLPPDSKTSSIWIGHIKPSPHVQLSK